MSNVTHLLVLLGLFAGLSEAARSQDEAVLFIGNSYTFESNAAGQFESIARANGHDVEVRLDAAPGAGIGRALADEDLMEAIRQGQYTHLILQPGGMSDNGQWRLDGRGIAATSLPPLAERLARYSEIAAGAGVEIWVVETWPSSTGTTGDRDNLRARLVEAIINSGGTVNLLPVGRAVWLARESGTEQLYQEDGHHPGAATATLYAQLTYLFRDETGQVLRRDHLHLEARLEGNQLVIMRDGALFGGAETLRAVMTDENALSGTASLLDPALNLRVEGRWSAERRGQSWNCFGDH